MYELNDKGPKDTISYAAKILSTDKKHILSIKIREDVDINSDYRQFTHEILRGPFDRSREDFHLLTHGTHLFGEHSEKCVLVEHESGLEILCAVASVAAIGSFVMDIISLWVNLRNQSKGDIHSTIQEIEFRRISHNEHPNDDGIETVTYPVDEIIRKQIDFNKYS